MARATSVALGDCFVPASRVITGGTTGLVWRVVDLFDGRDGIAYARLVKADDPSQSKTLATAALLDRALFRPLDR